MLQADAPNSADPYLSHASIRDAPILIDLLSIHVLMSRLKPRLLFISMKNWSGLQETNTKVL